MMPEIEEDLVKPEIRRKFAGNRAQLQLTVATTMEHQKFALNRAAGSRLK